MREPVERSRVTDRTLLSRWISVDASDIAAGPEKPSVASESALIIRVRRARARRRCRQVLPDS
eukprot:6929470-Prymnesium_polylepis.2